MNGLRAVAPFTQYAVHVHQATGINRSDKIGRGGGAKDDLSACDDEQVARALAACPMPTISAVGPTVLRKASITCASSTSRLGQRR